MATSQLFPLFPTAVGLYNFGKDYHKINESLVKDVFTELKKDPKGQIFSNIGGWHGRKEMENRYKSFKILRKQIEDCVNDYCQKTGFEDGLEIENLWANVNKNGDMNMGHHHGLSACTGVYYPIKDIVDEKYNYEYSDSVTLLPGGWSDDSGGGCITFQDPAYGQKIQLKQKAAGAASPYSLEFFHFYPVAGVLIVIPSHLIHHVVPFREENKTRISISFECGYGTD